MTHPPWCVLPCPVAQPALSDRRVHRGNRARVAGSGGSVESRLVQLPGKPPAILVTSSGWALTKTAELSIQDACGLRDNLDEQIAAAAAKEAPGPNVRPGPVEEGDRTP